MYRINRIVAVSNLNAYCPERDAGIVSKFLYSRLLMAELWEKTYEESLVDRDRSGHVDPCYRGFCNSIVSCEIPMGLDHP